VRACVYVRAFASSRCRRRFSIVPLQTVVSCINSFRVRSPGCIFRFFDFRFNCFCFIRSHNTLYDYNTLRNYIRRGRLLLYYRQIVFKRLFRSDVFATTRRSMGQMFDWSKILPRSVPPCTTRWPDNKRDCGIVRFLRRTRTVLGPTYRFTYTFQFSDRTPATT